MLIKSLFDTIERESAPLLPRGLIALLLLFRSFLLS
jgi:hypothetical protein